MGAPGIATPKKNVTADRRTMGGSKRCLVIVFGFPDNIQFSKRTFPRCLFRGRTVRSDVPISAISSGPSISQSDAHPLSLHPGP